MHNMDEVGDFQLRLTPNGGELSVAVTRGSEKVLVHAECQGPEQSYKPTFTAGPDPDQPPHLLKEEIEALAMSNGWLHVVAAMVVVRVGRASSIRDALTLLDTRITWFVLRQGNQIEIGLWIDRRRRFSESLVRSMEPLVEHHAGHLKDFAAFVHAAISAAGGWPEEG